MRTMIYLADLITTFKSVRKIMQDDREHFIMKTRNLNSSANVTDLLPCSIALQVCHINGTT